MSMVVDAEVLVRLSAKRADGTTVAVEYPMNSDEQWDDIWTDAFGEVDIPSPLKIGPRRWSAATRLRQDFEELRKLVEAS